MYRKRFFLTFSSALLVMLALAAPPSAGTKGLGGPGAFNKSTPIDKADFVSVWTITLDWDVSAGATAYDFCFDKTDDDTCNDGWIPAGTDTSAVITFLETDVTYYWQVRAFDGLEYTLADGDTWWSFNTSGPARFHARLIQNDIFGFDWPPGHSVTVTVDDPSNGVGIDFTDTKIVDSNGSVQFYDLGGLQVSPGMLIGMNDGEIFKAHTVISLQVTDVDVDTDVVSGTGMVGAHIKANNNSYSGRTGIRWVTVAGDGTWSVDFSTPGLTDEESEIVDIVPGTAGAVIYPDEDADHTDVDWYPWQKMIAYPNQDHIEGSGWPVGATVTVDVDDPATLANPDYTNTATVVVAPGSEAETWFPVDSPGEYDLKAGDIVTVSDGTTTKTHTVTGLRVTCVDVGADLVKGVAAPGSYVDTIICTQTICANRSVQVDLNGHWSTDFSVVGDQPWENITFDILPGTTGGASQWDDDADSTHVPWVTGCGIYLPLTLR